LLAAIAATSLGPRRKVRTHCDLKRSRMFRTTLLLISTVLLTTNMNAVVKVDKIE